MTFTLDKTIEFKIIIIIIIISLKVVPGYIITSYLAGDYFQALCNIIAPAALMVRQQSSLIITPE